jgi:hypothetical protein
MIHQGMKHNLSQVKQEVNETLRSYTHHFFEIRTTIANISDEDTIRCFRNRLYAKLTYREFRRNLPNTTVELRDMMQQWANQVDEENERFHQRTDKHSNDAVPTRTSATSQYRPISTSQTIKSRLSSAASAAVSPGFEEVLHKRCPIYPKSNHTLF